MKNIEKLAQILGGTIDSFSDGTGDWVHLEDHDISIDIMFKKDKFKSISIARKIYQVVDEVIIAKIHVPKIK